MPGTTDEAVVLTALAECADILFLAPGDERVTQDEVHDDARELIRRRGLPPGTPYAGWHTQASAFDRRGALRGPQRVYFGGDRETVGRALRRLEPAGYAVLGGRTDSEAFLIVRDARPAAADPAHLDDLRVRLALLADPGLTTGPLPEAQPVPLRAGETALLHATVATGGLASVHRQAFLALHQRHLLTAADIDQLLPTWRTVFPEDPSAYARAALDNGHPAAGALITELLADGAATADLLLAWGDPAALTGCRELALRGDSIDVYLRLAAADGTPPGAAAVALATEMRAAPDPDPARQNRRMEALGRALPAAVGDPGLSTARNIITTLRDGRVPGWLRAELARMHAYLPFRLRSELNRLTHEPSPGPGSEASSGPGSEASSGSEAEAVLGEWDAAVDGARRAAGLAPWPGFDPEDDRCRTAAAALLDEIVPGHEAGLRAHLEDPSATEPALATCLYLLAATAELRVPELVTLRRRWPELITPPPRNSAVPPAVLTFIRVLLEAGDPLGTTVAEAVLADRRAWSRPLRDLVAGHLRTDDDTATRLWTLAASTSSTAKGRQEAVHAYVLLDSRRSGTTAHEAAARAWSAAAVPEIPFVGRAFLTCAIARTDPRRPLWGHFDKASVHWLSAALEVAENDALPTDFRHAVLALARESAILTRPAQLRPIAVDRATAETLRDRLTRATTRLT